MDDIKDKLDKIKVALGDKDLDLSSDDRNWLLDWVNIQDSIAQDIQDILTYSADTVQYKDHMHQLNTVFQYYVSAHDKIHALTIRNEEVEDRHITNANAIRKEIIEIIDSLYEVVDPWFKPMRVQLEPIVKKLEKFEGDIKSPDFTKRMATQKEIWDIMPEVEKLQPIPRTTQFNDWIHDFTRSIRGYVGGIHYLERDIRNHNPDWELQESYQRIISFQMDLIASINALNDITTDLKEKNWIDELITDIKTDFPNTEINIEHNLHILCSSCVYRSIIRELKENYRKYGTDWQLSLTRENDMAVITLKNKKKERDEKDSSTKRWLPIFEEYMKEIGGFFSCDYSTDDCVTIIRLPIYVKK